MKSKQVPGFELKELEALNEEKKFIKNLANSKFGKDITPFIAERIVQDASPDELEFLKLNYAC